MKVPKLRVMFIFKDWFWVEEFCCIIVFIPYANFLSILFYLVNVNTVFKTFPI